MVQRLKDVDSLGAAAARGEAEETANTIRIEAIGRQRSYESALTDTRRQQALEGIRAKFIILVHEALAAGCAAARYEAAPASTR